MNTKFDVVVIGAGIYGRYIASELKKLNIDVAMIAKDDALNFRQSKTGVASLVNQARIHNGYHYPRSITTAFHSVNHYNQFKNDFKDAIITDFSQVYAIAKNCSLTSASQFEEFCKRLNIKCDTYYPSFLNQSYVSGSWLTEEVAIDTRKMMSIMQERSNHVDLIHDEVISIDELSDSTYNINTLSGLQIHSKMIFNCTYAGINTIETMIEKNASKLTQVKYEACEVSLFKLPQTVERTGITVMDGPFVSFMPFTNELWSLTSVVDTPHYESTSPILDITNLSSKYDVMKQRLSLFVNQSFIDQMEYIDSEYVVKTISKNSETDDNRLIHVNHLRDNFISVLSGKLNAIYELDTLIKKYAGEINVK